MENQNIKAIIFDWGRTLHSPETDELFPGAREIVEELSQKYMLALVSLATSQSEKDRRESIEKSGIAPCFKMILVSERDKDAMYERVMGDLNLLPAEVAVIDDRVVRGIAWGNKKGCMTIWVRQGKFANELPDESTGEPAYTILDVRDIKDIL